ncbi:helix-turn-helix domain-containing protein [Actinomadura macrotermitis]|uniref:HTH cro/C1-type domain-containing protein n=1 Tax=Actinomadura macrotermitis TaxID=2585200 RepID=A0A7K0BSR2_9ACTN|nr:helix-turn-helix transcriptional regulator [Actinomadura macrotermitis]MQY04220.1 hypothetical protein [Actinomadura macrotermitis]
MPQESGVLIRDPLIRVFSTVLRAYREHARLTRPQLAEALGCTYQWIEKLETGTKPSVDTAIDLDTFFQLSGKPFAEMAREIERIGKKSVPVPGFPEFLMLEERALSMQSFDAQVIPGLLQTEEYARGVIGAGQMRSNLDEMVMKRLKRQLILGGEKPPRLGFVIDESALHRPIGGPKVMQDQLLHLEELVTGFPNVQIRMLPFERVIWAALDGSFKVMSFADGPQIAYVEGPGCSQLIREPDAANESAVRFDLVLGEALSIGESLGMIRRSREGYSDQR